MAAAVLLPTAPTSFSHMKVQTFRGDADILVDRLIAASQRKEVALDTLQERPLVPYFDSSDASASSFQALQAGHHQRAASKPLPVPVPTKGKAHGQQGLKRAERSSGALAASPPKKENEVLQARHQRRAKPAHSGGSASASDTEMSSAPAQPRTKKGGRKGGKASAPAPAVLAVPRPSPRKAPRAAGGAQLDMAALAAASASAAGALRTPGGRHAPPASTKFAGPAFTNSPMPDCLPIPTSSLLLQDAADGLRARLTL